MIVPEEGIYIALNSILRAGDHVICTFPGYQSLYEVARGLGCQVTRWEPQEQNGWRFDPDFLEKNIRPNTRLVIVNFPHNPTGSYPSMQDYQKIVDLARKNDLYLFSDEMYRFLEYDPALKLPSACEVYEKAVSLFGMSKTFGMAGARVGWLVTKDAGLYQKMAAFKDYTTICGSAPSEILSIIALRSKEVIIGRHLARIKRNLALLDRLLCGIWRQVCLGQAASGHDCFSKTERALCLPRTSASGLFRRPASCCCPQRSLIMAISTSGWALVAKICLKYWKFSGII